MTFTLDAQGSILIVHNNARRLSLKRRVALRGKIRAFTPPSRRRMIEAMARLAIVNVRTTFLTLTFAAPPSPEAAKTALHAFLQRIRRRFPRASGFWRMEYQQRGAIHFHLLLFNFPYIHQTILQRVWESYTHEPRSIVHVRLVKNKRMAMSYVAKYLGKVEANATSLDTHPYLHVPQTDDPGRFWGVHNSGCLPLAPHQRIIFDDDDLGAYIWWAVKHLSRGRACRAGRASRYYCDDPYILVARALADAADVLADDYDPGGKRFDPIPDVEF